MIPENVSELVKTSVPLPATTKAPEPLITPPKIMPEKDAPLAERSKTSRPLSTMFPPRAPVAPPFPTCSVAAPVIVVPPEYVSELVKTSVPLPTTTRAPEPLITPPIMNMLPFVSKLAVALGPITILRLAGRVTDPLACSALAPPAAKVTLAVGAPKAASLPIETTPGSSVSPPDQLVLLPVKVSVPLPALISWPEPLIVPLNVVSALLPPTTSATGI